MWSISPPGLRQLSCQVPAHDPDDGQQIWSAAYRERTKGFRHRWRLLVVEGPVQPPQTPNFSVKRIVLDVPSGKEAPIRSN